MGYKLPADEMVFRAQYHMNVVLTITYITYHHKNVWQFVPHLLYLIDDELDDT